MWGSFQRVLIKEVVEDQGFLLGLKLLSQIFYFSKKKKKKVFLSRSLRPLIRATKRPNLDKNGPVLQSLRAVVVMEPLTSTWPKSLRSDYLCRRCSQG